MSEPIKVKMNKLDKAVDFFCYNCKQEKKSKNIADYAEVKLCNGCYGELLSKGVISADVDK